MWDLIVSVPDHCLSFYFEQPEKTRVTVTDASASQVQYGPGSRHTKVVKSGTSYSWLGTQTYGVELGLVDQCQENVTGCGITSSV